jgi:hypothetical protein
MGLTGLNVGVIVGLTETLKVVVVAHCPAAGVNAYVVVAWLLMAGLQVPVIPFKELVDNVVKFPPLQTGFTGSNVGVMIGLIVIIILAVAAHCPELGVNV